MRIQFVVERHHEGYVAYPVGLRGVVTGRGATREQAIAALARAIRARVHGPVDELVEAEAPALEVEVGEAQIPPARDSWRAL